MPRTEVNLNPSLWNRPGRCKSTQKSSLKGLQDQRIVQLARDAKGEMKEKSIREIVRRLKMGRFVKIGGLSEELRNRINKEAFG